MKPLKTSTSPLLSVTSMVVAAGLASGLGLVTGCDALTGGSGTPTQATAAAAPKPTVNLPPPPNFQEARVQEKWEDGSYSIYGLRSNIDDRVKEGDAGTEVMVKGYVQEVYVPPECPEGEMCPPGKQAHFWITDKANQGGKKRAMMVVNYKFNIPDHEKRKWRKQPEVRIEPGKRYTIKGKFKRFSDTGFAHNNGLLEFVSYKPLDGAGQELADWVYPPGADWHPINVAAMEEQNRKMAERAQKALKVKKKKRK